MARPALQKVELSVGEGGEAGAVREYPEGFFVWGAGDGPPLKLLTGAKLAARVY